MAHFTEASFWVENRILIEKNCFGSFSRPPRPTFQPIFDLKMAIFRIFSSQILTNVPINAIFGMYPHNSSSFKGESLILTSKVTKGHLRSSEVNKRRSSEIKKMKKTCLGTFILHQISFQMVYNTWNNLVFKKIIIFFFSTKSSFLSKSHTPPVEALKIMESGFF